jgi:hypothetical protein
MYCSNEEADFFYIKKEKIQVHKYKSEASRIIIFIIKIKYCRQE